MRFLLDENIPRAVATGLRRRFPDLAVLRVGSDGGPPLGSTDGELLEFAEASQAQLVTRDRRTMPEAVAAHLAAGHSTWGVVIVSVDARLGSVIDDLSLMVEASEPSEWRNRITYLPLSP